MLRSVIKSLADEGRTILMSSHVIEVVEQLCTDVVILSDGNVVAHDRVDDCAACSRTNRSNTCS